MNEVLLILSLFLIYGSVLAAYKFLGKEGLFCYTVFATVTANLEVMLVVDAFGMEQTLGNILFASTFLITDILSECEGKKAANKAVNLGIITSVFFIILTQMWLQYIPAASDWASESFHVLFTNTPRIMLASVVVYAVCQKFDVWLYHKWWAITDNKFGNHDRFLWLRNNGSTMISQMLNTVLYTFGAFGNLYDMSTLINICISTYVIYLVTSLVDTPVLYAARKLKKCGKIQKNTQ